MSHQKRTRLLEIAKIAIETVEECAGAEYDTLEDLIGITNEERNQIYSLNINISTEKINQIIDNAIEYINNFRT